MQAFSFPFSLIINKLHFKFSSCSVSFGRKSELNAHIDMLRKEFSGKTYLEFFHAATTCFIRRRLNLDHCLANFRQIWQEESVFMCEHLDTRWLVSACDTIIDHFEDPNEVAVAIGGTLFMNTCKLCGRKPNHLSCGSFSEISR